MEKILVVDDVEANRKILQKMVSNSGHQVLVANNGEEAITLFKNEKPALVLMDIMMPGVNGLDAGKQIKSLSGDTYTPVIFVTALSQETTLATALESGGDDYIAKPVDKNILHSKIKAHLRIRELNQKLNDTNYMLKKYNQYLLYEQDLIEHFFENALKRSYLDETFIKYHMSSQSTFNGDLLLVEKDNEGSIYVVFGDFTGHGLTASIGTLPVAQVFFNLVPSGISLEDLVKEINKQLLLLLPVEMFFAAAILKLDAMRENLAAWSGGIPQITFYGKDGALCGQIESAHMPLGVLDESEFDSSLTCLPVKTGDKIYLYSDGIAELKNDKGEIFGTEMLEKVMAENTRNRFEKLLEALNKFQGDNHQIDDMTLVELTV